MIPHVLYIFYMCVLLLVLVFCGCFVHTRSQSMFADQFKFVTLWIALGIAKPPPCPLINLHSPLVIVYSEQTLGTCLKYVVCIVAMSIPSALKIVRAQCQFSAEMVVV